MNSRNGAVEYRDGGTVNRMVMDDGVSIRAGLIHNLMKTPFAGGQFIFFVSPLCIYIDDTLFGQTARREFRSA
ncbi:hypothetical protein PGS1_09840 [Enterobacter cloacae subsp. cloacae GS1]|nr:hypothetical protein PGS1_09840 [Enterobacter cloacae subsp. cloacae GS1]